MRQSYPSDISREQFSVIEADLTACRSVTKPRKCELYDVFCAVLYRLCTGCRWRHLPHDFPKWQNVYRYWSIWTEQDKSGVTLIDRLMHGLVQMERVCDGRDPETTMLIIDSRSVKNVDTPEESGYDTGKKRKG